MVIGVVWDAARGRSDWLSHQRMQSLLPYFDSWDPLRIAGWGPWSRRQKCFPGGRGLPRGGTRRRSSRLISPSLCATSRGSWVRHSGARPVPSTKENDAGGIAAGGVEWVRAAWSDKEDLIILVATKSVEAGWAGIVDALCGFLMRCEPWEGFDTGSLCLLSPAAAVGRERGCHNCAVLLCGSLGFWFLSQVVCGCLVVL